MKFYSFIVPARNEESYIENTLTHLSSLDFPKEKYEVILVESNSTDKTLKIASRYKSKTIKVYHIEKKGVSNARNFGAYKTSKRSNWLIFLDADTIVKNNFLKEFDNFISKNNEKYAYGAFEIHPLERHNKKINLFLRFYNHYLKFFKISFAIQAINKNYFVQDNKAKYDSKLEVGEDYQILKEISKYGKYFFLNTNQVETSIRRFEKMGIIKVVLIWLLGANLPKKIKVKLKYPLVR